MKVLVHLDLAASSGIDSLVNRKKAQKNFYCLWPVKARARVRFDYYSSPLLIQVYSTLNFFFVKRNFEEEKLRRWFQVTAAAFSILVEHKPEKS